MDQAKTKQLPPVDFEQRTKEQIANLTFLARHFQKRIVEETGGGKGTRDEAALESAVAAPFATYFGEDLHIAIFEKAAALMRSLSLNHPFVDGNKRTSLGMTALFLFERGFGFKDDLSDDEVVDFCISVASGEKKLGEISSWLEGNTDRASAKSFKSVMAQLGRE